MGVNWLLKELYPNSFMMAVHIGQIITIESLSIGKSIAFELWNKTQNSPHSLQHTIKIISRSFDRGNDHF